MTHLVFQMFSANLVLLLCVIMFWWCWVFDGPFVFSPFLQRQAPWQCLSWLYNLSFKEPHDGSTDQTVHLCHSYGKVQVAALPDGLQKRLSSTSSSAHAHAHMHSHTHPTSRPPERRNRHRHMRAPRMSHLGQMSHPDSRPGDSQAER